MSKFIPRSSEPDVVITKPGIIPRYKFICGHCTCEFEAIAGDFIFSFGQSLVEQYCPCCHLPCTADSDKPLRGEYKVQNDWDTILKHYNAIPVLISGIRNIRSQVLANKNSPGQLERLFVDHQLTVLLEEWDKARS